MKAHREFFAAMVMAATASFACITVRAATITVAQDGTGDYPTIQEGIDAAVEGDVVRVMPGYYAEASEREINGRLRGANVILKTGVTVEGAGPDSTIIAANNREVGIDAGILAVDVQDAVLEGFTITGHIDWGEQHYQYYGVALLAEHSTLTISGNIFDGYIVKPGEPQNSGCQFFGTMASVRADSEALIYNNVFLYADDISVSAEDSTADIDNNTFYGWEECVEGTAICGRNSVVNVANNTFSYIEDGIDLCDLHEGEESILTLSHNNYWGVDVELADFGSANVIYDEGGHVHADPMHALVNLRYGEYDFSLSPGSPLIDAGDNAAVPESVDTDLAGDARFVDDPATPDTGSGTAPIVDIGAYEHQESCEEIMNSLGDPIALEASPSCDRVELTWSDNVMGEAAFLIERRSLSDNGDWILLAEIPGLPGSTGDLFSFTDENAPGGQTCKYLLEVESADGDVCAWFYSAGVEIPGAPETPTNLTAEALGRRGPITLTWSDCSSEDGYTIRKLITNLHTGVAKYVICAELEAGTTSWQDSAVHPGYRYDYSIRAYNECGESPFSAPATVTLSRW